VLRIRGAAQGDHKSEQSHIANYWSCFSYTATPAGRWNDILSGIFSTADERDLRKVARFYAILNVALADAGLAAWDSKYHYEFWRPIQAIRQAGADGNPLTEPDEEWISLLESPPHPEYVSGHSAFSGAGAAALAALFGSDTVHFVSHNPDYPDQDRHYTSLWACAEECGMSRIYGGIHFSFSNREGLKLGRRVAEYVVENVFSSNPAAS
ncbi:MAG: vanadium-dependent haloperoxidase, partial [Puniceicoccaceae bacterium]